MSPEKYCTQHNWLDSKQKTAHVEFRERNAKKTLAKVKVVNITAVLHPFMHQYNVMDEYYSTPLSL